MDFDWDMDQIGTEIEFCFVRPKVSFGSTYGCTQYAVIHIEVKFVDGLCNSYMVILGLNFQNFYYLGNAGVHGWVGLGPAWGE